MCTVNNINNNKIINNMKKLKFFFMLALLLTAVTQGAWADNGWSVWDGSESSEPKITTAMLASAMFTSLIMVLN